MNTKLLLVFLLVCLSVSFSTGQKKGRSIEQQKFDETLENYLAKSIPKFAENVVRVKKHIRRSPRQNQNTENSMIL